jgi:flagellar motor switch protein FliM
MTTKPDESNKKKPPSNEILSKDEVENLLNMMSYPPPPKPDENRENPAPERLDKAQLKQLQLMHEKLVPRLTAKISTMLQCVTEIKLTSIDHLSYSEFIFSCDIPTCYNLIQIKSPFLDNTENMILDINPSILYPMIDRMLGGGREVVMCVRRPPTKIETRLIRRVIDEFLKELEGIWEKISALEFTVVQTESNPQLMRFAEYNEEMIVICFEVNFVEIRGYMVLCIPVGVVKQILPKGTSDE